MIHPADLRGAPLDGPLAAQFQQSGEGHDTAVRTHHDHDGIVGRPGHADHVVDGQRTLAPGHGEEVRRRDRQQRVPVSRPAVDVVHGDHASATRTRQYAQIRIQHLAHATGHGACRRVGAAAGGRVGDDVDGALGKVRLCIAHRGCQTQLDCGRDCEGPAHGCNSNPDAAKTQQRKALAADLADVRREAVEPPARNTEAVTCGGGPVSVYRLACGSIATIDGDVPYPRESYA